MNKIYLQTTNGKSYSNAPNDSFYYILIFNGNSNFEINFTEYEFSGYTILFISPYQLFKWKKNLDIEIKLIKFHSDYYCIEYHKMKFLVMAFFSIIYTKILLLI